MSFLLPWLSHTWMKGLTSELPVVTKAEPDTLVSSKLKTFDGIF